MVLGQIIGTGKSPLIGRNDNLPGSVGACMSGKHSWTGVVKGGEQEKAIVN